MRGQLRRFGTAGTLVAASAVLVGGTSVGQQKRAPPPPAGTGVESGSARVAGTPQAHRPDEAVARVARAAVAEQLGPRAAGRVTVSVKDRLAVLTGNTDTLLAKLAVAEAVESVRGVRSVINKVEVHPAMQADSTIAQDVRRSWDTLPRAEQNALAVDVRQGIVKVSGTVQSEQLRQWAGRAAAGVRGVIDVRNEIAVTPPPRRSDAAIAEDVQRRLRWALPLDAGAIAVAVRDGTVFLRGSVATPADFKRAEMLSRVTGTRAVDASKLDVDPDAFPGGPRVTATHRASDEALAQAIRDALFYDPQVDSDRLLVRVRDSVATVDGKVPNLRTARAALEDVRGTAGITRTIDLMSVPAAPVASDALVARRVREAFARDPLDDLRTLGVQADRGLVQLFGPVAGQLAHARALEVASSVQGVRALEDGITLAEGGTSGQ